MSEAINSRSNWLVTFFSISFFAVIIRLFFWQVVKGNNLQVLADNQYQRSVSVSGSRGEIFFADGTPLVTNKEVYRLFAEPRVLNQSSSEIVSKLVPLLLTEYKIYQEATEAAQKKIIEEELKASISQKLEDKSLSWISIKTQVSAQLRKQIEDLDIHGLGFDNFLVRSYPEASMAAHLTGFVGKDNDGIDIGYFGVEGELENELRARTDYQTIFTDALGFQLNVDGQDGSSQHGRDVVLTIERDIQFLIEAELKKGVEQYSAESGEVIVLRPQTGEVLGLASYPNYDQSKFVEFDSSLYKNPSLSNLYEPGSTFKVLTVAAGIDQGVIEPETACDNCSGPRQFGKYTIRTWNDQYTPNITMTEALAKSDNTAMIFIAEKLGVDTFTDYLRRFDISQPVGVELQEDAQTIFPEKWGPVELATSSFGQGISINSFQLVKAVSAIANQGVLMKPTVIKSVLDTANDQKILNRPEEIRRVVSKETAQTITEMMVSAAEHGEAQWIASKTHTVAGKTGTSQVAEGGEYLEDKTIASFIGFAPASNPEFIMLVKLNAPQSSPWAAETAAPLWYKIAQKLYLLENIPPDK